MRTNEVNASLIGRRVKGISFGEMVTGTVFEIENNKHAVCVHFKLDTPQYWGDYKYCNAQAWARKADEFGSLHYMTLL